MPSFFSHAIAGVAIGSVAVGGRSRMVLWALAATCAVVPDLDVIGMFLGIPYRHMLGHRGLSHSLFFAAVLASVVTTAVCWTLSARPSATRLWVLFLLTTASHGLLDAMTNGGLGVAFFAPFDDTRYFLSWRPILVSPISIHAFFSYRGLRVMESELLLVWLPAVIVFVGAVTGRRLLSSATSRERPDPSGSSAPRRRRRGTGRPAPCPPRSYQGRSSRS